MTQEFRTRSEHTRSIENKEIHRAIKALIELGLLIPVKEIETYHGRKESSDNKTEWKVDPNYDNGPGNVNAMKTLYTGDQNTADAFAQARIDKKLRVDCEQHFRDIVTAYTLAERLEWLDRLNKSETVGSDSFEDMFDSEMVNKESGKYVLKDLDKLANIEARRLQSQVSPSEQQNKIVDDLKARYRKEIHRIINSDPDATLLDIHFDYASLSAENQQRFNLALNTLVIPITLGAPVIYEDRNVPDSFRLAINEALSKSQKNYLEESDFLEIVNKTGMKLKLVRHLCSAFNAGQLFQVEPTLVVHELSSNSSEVFNIKIDSNGQSLIIPTNAEYLRGLLREAHIVGFRQQVLSDTLGKKIVSNSFFDLEKTMTSDALEKKRREAAEKFGEIATLIDSLIDQNLPTHSPVLAVFEDVHAKPKKLIEVAKTVEGFKHLFEGDTGNWEGFTLEEHTATVLNNFDHNYADYLPVSLLMPIRLMIAVHDLGKPIAAGLGKRKEQKQYNIEQANNFLDKLNIHPHLKEIIVSIIGEGADLSFQIEMRNGGETARNVMEKLAKETLAKILPENEITSRQITGFIELCKILLVCDGGAYTSMAITHGKAAAYRNYPQFNESFMPPTDPARRRLEIK